ncbi:MAG: DUF92 domain-containing protein [Gemmatimonadota bacterium]|nr:DUF92 domain-containing protein [Gemmatimonadota bacterium]
MIARTAAGALIAAAIAIAAWRAGSLSRSGAVAALFIGTLGVAAGWDWGALLILYFLSSSLLSRIGTTVKAQRSGSIVEKGGARDATQVLANGAAFAAAAALQLLVPSSLWLVAGAGALAASAADTWGTEIGMLAKSSPRMITTWREVPTGTSGGVSAVGLVASVGGALFIAVAAWLMHRNAHAALAVLLGGIIGAFVDSIGGALWQSRRVCTHCGSATERLVHDCGTQTERAGGLGWLNNDGVNAACTVIGALAAVGTIAILR